MLTAQQGHYEAALALATYVHQQPPSPQEAKDRVQKLSVERQSLLTPQQLKAVQAQVQTWSLEAAVKETLDRVTGLQSYRADVRPVRR